MDGFNLYHAVAALDRPILKWLDVASLARSYLREDQELAAVHFFTALNTWSQDKRQRHINVVKALQHTGATVHTARFDRVDKYCRKADRFCAFNEEKQSDVGIAVQALADAFDGHADVMFFLTADSDQIPTLKRLAMRFPEKRIFLVAPPGRLTHARARRVRPRRVPPHRRPPRTAPIAGISAGQRWPPDRVPPHPVSAARGIGRPIR